jgi:hypothetical protein
MDNRNHVTDSWIELQEENATRDAASSVDATMPRSCLALSIVFLIAIYLASMSPGTASGDFASMTVFP